MKNIVLFLTIFLFSIVRLEAQNFIILNSGEYIEYKKYKLDHKKEIITINKPKYATVKISDVDYFINSYSEKHYLKKIDAYNPNTLIKKNSYKEMIKLIEGIISIYTYEVCRHSAPVGMAPGNTTCFTYYYLEKGNEFVELTFDLLSNLTNDLTIFSEYFSDDNQTYQKLNSENFKAKRNRLFDLIRNYNIRMHDLHASSAKNEFCNAIFYRSFSSEDKDLIAVIELEDSEVTLSYSAYQLVRLYDNKLMKICITNNENKHYELVSGSKHAVRYFNIRLKNNGEIELESKNKREFERYLEMVRKNKSD